jgi:tetratricopeptide (TPR) repeat protein
MLGFPQMNAPPEHNTFQERRRRAQLALKAGQALLAERQLRALLAEVPGEVNCVWLLGVAQLDQENPEAAAAIFESVLAAAPDFAMARVDLARAHRASSRAHRARDEVRRVLESMPQLHRAWLAYGDILFDLGQYDDARIAFERAQLCDPCRVTVEQATAALVADDRKGSEELFRSILQQDPAHVAALCGLAALSLEADVPKDAERLLRHALKQSAHAPLAWRGLGPALLALGRLQEAEASARHLLQIEPENPQSWITLAGVSARLLKQEEALAAYQKAASLKPQEVRLQMSIGHVNKTLGRRTDSEQAYKRALSLVPGYAEAWWSLADLKNYDFSDAEVETLSRLLAQEPAGSGNEAQLAFALGKALEQRRRYPEAFAQYARGNARRRRDAPFNIGHFEQRSQRLCRFFDAPLFAARAGWGNPDPAPIFIVGLPRSGSTLIEQILASHSAVEGTMELPNILNIVREFEDRGPGRDGYPESLQQASAAQMRLLGTRYLTETAPLRPGGRAHFTDKLPNNFSHVGLIQLLLPNARIIDARRHPMDCCFSTFKQHFAEGQTFSYDLEDLGRYYRCYLQLMDHWNAVLPGKVLQVQYEDLVREPESNIRRLLDHCGLPFEPACLAFHTTRRPVRTASAEQVRQPIYTSGVGYWRCFEKELAPLRQALGESLQRFEKIS